LDNIEEVDKDKCEEVDKDKRKEEKEAVNTPEDACQYQIKSYVGAVYQGEWFVG
jgi:hypothetical protein